MSTCRYIDRHGRPPERIEPPRHRRGVKERRRRETLGENEFRRSVRVTAFAAMHHRVVPEHEECAAYDREVARREREAAHQEQGGRTGHGHVEMEPGKRHQLEEQPAKRLGRKQHDRRADHERRGDDVGIS